jgi:tetratricopeptide (TPR) repeat protein
VRLPRLITRLSFDDRRQISYAAAMSKIYRKLLAIVPVAVAMAFAVCAFMPMDALAQPAPDPPAKRPPAAKPQDPKSLPPAEQPPGGKDPGTDAPKKSVPGEPQAKAGKRPQLGKVIPDGPGDRAKLLDDLYAHLATASDEDASKPFAEAIERIWLTPGSDTVSALMERAMQSVGQQRNDLALQLLTSVVDLAPDYAEGWNRRAYVFYTEGDYERALGDLRRVLALDANHYKALDGVGQIMRQLDRKPQALKAYEQLLAVHPHWPNIQTIVEELRREVEGRGI